MNAAWDIDKILKPLPGEKPAGEDLIYDSLYDRIKEKTKNCLRETGRNR